ncbi:sodium/hydrogen exchanger family domain-containing protein [Phthorimaea operculella]|nr:sodium/hydrogen exchanger family domain-containing protein [Phthorimaea operculella]
MKTRDRRVKQEVRSVKTEQPQRGAKGRAGGVGGVGGKPGSPRLETARERAKRSGIEAVKLHLEATGFTGRTSRSASAVRKTSVRMTAIKEYPFDLSDVEKKEEQERQMAADQPAAEEKAPDSSHPAEPSPAESSQPEASAPDSTQKEADSSKPVEPSTQPPEPTPQPPMPESAMRGSRPSVISNPRKVSIMENLPDKNGRLSASAEGPSRRKSNLHNAMQAEMDNSWDRPQHIEGRFKKYSTASSIYSKKALSQHSEHVERSWWYACCANCHQEEPGIPSWEPPNWQKVCPYPLCPSYRQFAQTLGMFLIGAMVWVTAWVEMGETAAPGGQLFMLVMLTLAAYFGGWLMQKITTLPALIGMLLVGILVKNVELVNFDETYLKVGSYVRKVALTIILTRAGLDLDPHAMKKFFFTVIKLALLPWTFECCLCAVMSHFILGFPWDWAFLLGSIIAAVSPAVIVPCLFRLREKGYGVSKGIPTLVLAVSGVDDAASVAVFGIVSSFMFGTSSMTVNIIQGPASIICGIALGVFCGYLVKYVPEKNDAFVVPLRVLLLLTGGLMAVLGSEEIGWGGAGPLMVIAFAFVAGKNWTDQGWDLEDNPVATAFEIFWMLFEPMLFGVTGAQVVIKELPLDLVLKGSGILIVCMVLRALLTTGAAVRSNLNTKEKFFVGLAWMAKATVQSKYQRTASLLGTGLQWYPITCMVLRALLTTGAAVRSNLNTKEKFFVGLAWVAKATVQWYPITCMVLRALLTTGAAVRSNLNTKEKFFVGLAWMAKATVQAALGSVALDEVRKMTAPEGSSLDVLEGYAQTVVTICILSIVITAPIGAIVITIAGPRLLSKTSKPPVLEGWRRSHRPSIRDISIINEEDAADRDAESDDVVVSPTAFSTPGPITVQPNHRT